MKVNRFQNQVALITGASGGMGQEIAKLLAVQGADLMLADISDENLAQLKADLKNSDRRIEISVGDLSNKDYCDNLPGQVYETFGKLDIVVNNAGLMRRGAITDTIDDDYALSFAINVDAPFRICRAAIPMMVQGWRRQNREYSFLLGIIPGTKPCHLLHYKRRISHHDKVSGT